MERERLDRLELREADSDYLCLFCYDPLYYNEQTQKEICANPNCIICPANLKIYSYSPQAIKPFLEKFNMAIRKCSVFSKQFFYKILHEIRSDACHNLLINSRLDLQHLLGINYLLVSLGSNTSWGNSKDIKQCHVIILECLKSYNELHRIELLESKNIILTQNSEAYVIKCSEVIDDMRKNLGIVNLNKHGTEDTHSFDFIDRQASGKKPRGLYDFEALFKNSYPLPITLNHLFKLGHSVSEIHRYPAKPSDLMMLVALCNMCRPGKLYTMDYDKLKQTYSGVVATAKIPGNFNEFLQNYSSGEKYAPIIINDGFLYRFDYGTLLITLFYIVSLNQITEGSQTQSGLKELNDQRAISARNFEKAIREKFKKENYVVFPTDDDKKFEPSFNGKHREYDCIAIDKNSKKIILIEAKYADITPSSTAGKTIVEQVVLNKHDGLLLHCKKQHERKQFFIKHCNKMPFGIKQFCNYRIISLIVTKYTPLIKKYLTTSIMSYDEFKDYDFKAAE